MSQRSVWEDADLPPDLGGVLREEPNRPTASEEDAAEYWQSVGAAICHLCDVVHAGESILGYEQIVLKDLEQVKLNGNQHFLMLPRLFGSQECFDTWRKGGFTYIFSLQKSMLEDQHDVTIDDLFPCRRRIVRTVIAERVAALDAQENGDQ